VAPVRQGAAAAAVAQGGTGPIRVLFISAYHPYDRENLALTLDALGQDISWTHIEHPAAEAFYDPRLSANYDVYLFYDAFAGRAPGGNGSRMSGADTVPSAQTQANLKALLQAGNKGFVFFHHSVASWAHTWPAGVNGSNAYSEVIGGVADWGAPLKNVRGKDYPPSGFKVQPQRITVVDKNHPITAGVEDFDIVDESYLWPVFEDSVHPLLRTNAVQTAENYRPQQAGHPTGSSLSGWYKAAERSPVVYLQHGHSNDAWTNPAFRRLMTNAIKWAASPEAKTWAHANAKRIFV
jgi:type 1 glutamine amidotransferase